MEWDVECSADEDEVDKEVKGSDGIRLRKGGSKRRRSGSGPSAGGY